jgi:hypothetical protein
LDDWSSGYTIRKIDLLLDPVASYPGRQIITGGFLGKQRLPPATMRLQAPRGSPTHVVASGSSKLMFLQPVDPSTKPTPLSRNFVPIVDVRMRSTSLGPRPTENPVDPIYVPVGDGGDRLFALDSRGAFSVLCPAPLDPQESWSWRALPDPPFERRHVVSYAARPDGGLVVSTKASDDSEASFTLTMAGAEGKPEWNRHYMFMPFAGRGHFVPALDAFVGLSGAPCSVGHLCVVYMDGSQKLSKEKLFGKDSVVEREVKVFGPNSPVERQVGSTLVYMGGRNNFCLVQCFSVDETSGSSIVEANGSKMDADQDGPQIDIVGETMDDGKLDDDQDVSGHNCCLFRLTAFFLKHDKNGDVGIDILQVQYFNVPEGVTQLALKNPAAFWM